MNKDLKKLNSGKLSTYFRKCKAKATKAMNSKANSSFRKGSINRKRIEQRTGSFSIFK